LEIENEGYESFKSHISGEANKRFYDVGKKKALAGLDKMQQELMTYPS